MSDMINTQTSPHSCVLSLCACLYVYIVHFIFEKEPEVRNVRSTSTILYYRSFRLVSSLQQLILNLTLTPWVFSLESILNPSESASVDIGHILNPPKSTTNFLVDFGRFRIPCSHENLYSMLLHRIHQNLTYIQYM